MKVILSHPTGNAFVRAAAAGFIKANLLYRFDTTIASFPDSFLFKMGSLQPLSEIRRRAYHSQLRPYTHTYPWIEAGRLLSIKAGFHNLIEHEKGILSVDSVFTSFDKHVASTLNRSAQHGVDAIYTYEDVALHSFREAKKVGMKCLYDLPIGYWRTARRLMENERERWPEWASTLTGFKDSDAKLVKKDEELKLADVIFVASTFTAKTLSDYPGVLASVKVVPYGFPDVTEVRTYSGIENKKKLKILFVGGLSQRKGIADLFAVVDKLKNYVELTVVGRTADHTCIALQNELNKCRWMPSIAHKEVLQLMKQHDVLIFPSLFEGFGLVITEAMSQGTPVITTDRTAGPDIIEHGKNGWLIEAASTIALENAIEYFIQHRKEITYMGKEAQKAARLRPWNLYGEELAHSILAEHKNSL